MAKALTTPFAMYGGRDAIAGRLLLRSSCRASAKRQGDEERQTGRTCGGHQHGG